MTATRRGANSKLSAKLRVREDAQRIEATQVSEEAQAADSETSSYEITYAEASALTMSELKERLTAKNLSTTGKKADLVARLVAS
jgi:hypothetical protein